MLDRIATVTTENGYQWTTSINGTNESISKYFLGAYFHTEPFPSEVMSQAVKVVIDNAFTVYFLD